VPLLERDAARLGVRLERSALQMAVLATDDGRDLRTSADEAEQPLIRTLLQLVLS
jgi:hypothetical protein